MIPVAHDSLSTLLICSLRYALGRHSYVVGQVAGIVREHYGKLWINEREVLIRDVEAHVKQDAINVRSGLPCPTDHECDHVEWRTLLEWMKTTKETGR